MRKVIGIVLFIAALFCITGGNPYFVTNMINAQILGGYAFGLILLIVSSRMFEKQYFTIVIGLATFISGLHLLVFVHIINLSSDDNIKGVLLGCAFIAVGASMILIFIRKRKKLIIADR